MLLKVDVVDFAFEQLDPFGSYTVSPKALHSHFERLPTNDYLKELNVGKLQPKNGCQNMQKRHINILIRYSDT